MNTVSMTKLIRVALIALVITWLCAFVMPGHRQQIVEEDIQLRVKSPSLQQKQEIRNKALTAIENLTADTCIEFAVKENKLYELVIRSIDNKVSYAYTLDSKEAKFDKRAIEWFAEYGPMITQAVFKNNAQNKLTLIGFTQLRSTENVSLFTFYTKVNTYLANMIDSVDIARTQII